MESLIKENIKTPIGFSARPAILEDAKAISELYNMYHKKFYGSNGYTVQEVETDMQMPKFDLVTDSQVVTNGAGEVVGFSFVYATANIPVAPFLAGRVDFDYLNLGIASFLHDWGIERAKKVIEKLPNDVRVVAAVGTDHNWQPGIEFFENNGMKNTRMFFTMMIEMYEKPAKPSWPEGIEIKTYRHPTQAKDVYLAIEDAFKDHFGFVEEDEESGFKKFEHSMFKDEGFDPDLWYLAMDGDKIAGFVLCRKMGWESDDEGYIAGLGVSPNYRRNGLASSLLLYAFRDYFERNQKIVTLDVDGESLTGAVDLYRKVGMDRCRQINRFEIELKSGRDIRRQ
jgi:mycothiol synthase